MFTMVVTDLKTEYKGERLILAKNLLSNVFGSEEVKILEEFSGDKLIGKSYKPVFDYYKNIEIKNIENIYKVWHADFVDDTAGTGIAHEAPAFGEDDYNLAMQNNIPLILHIGMDGKFKPEVTDFAGERVKWKGETQATDKKICEFLAGQNKILKTEIISHSYPLCWRCDTPLLNFATSSWFVAVSQMREKLVEENKKVYWVPENVRDGRMGQWLEGARDWALSRNRYWGAPLPVWKTNEEVFVPGSLKELQERTKAKNNYFLVRHGETEANVKHVSFDENPLASGEIDVVLGQDFSLNENGKKQAEQAANTLSQDKIDVIISSPYKRTLETAKIIAKNLGMSEEQIVIEEKSQEWQVGAENNGKSWNEFYNENKNINYLHHLMKGAKETKLDVQNRMNKLVDELEEKYAGKNIC
jgi:isoleucyl-tRNA synthetase